MTVCADTTVCEARQPPPPSHEWRPIPISHTIAGRNHSKGLATYPA